MVIYLPWLEKYISKLNFQTLSDPNCILSTCSQVTTFYIGSGSSTMFAQLLPSTFVSKSMSIEFPSEL